MALLVHAGRVQTLLLKKERIAEGSHAASLSRKNA
jgi:hypothetical protein